MCGIHPHPSSPLLMALSALQMGTSAFAAGGFCPAPQQKSSPLVLPHHSCNLARGTGGSRTIAALPLASGSALLEASSFLYPD